MSEDELVYHNAKYNRQTFKNDICVIRLRRKKHTFEDFLDIGCPGIRNRHKHFYIAIDSAAQGRFQDSDFQDHLLMAYVTHNSNKGYCSATGQSHILCYSYKKYARNFGNDGDSGIKKSI